MEHNENSIEILSDREHVLLRHSMYLGSLSLIEKESLFLVDNKFKFKQYKCVDGILKIINEIIDNSIDESIRTNYKFANKINIDISKDTVKIKDNGRGLSQAPEVTTGEIQAVVAFTHAKAGSNFRSDDTRTTIGLNGVGSFVTNCFSNIFTVVTSNGESKLTLNCLNNASDISHTVEPSKMRRGTTVTFKPDLERMGVEEIDDLHIDLIRQRITHLSISHPKISFKFNGIVMNMKEEEYIAAYSDECVYMSTDDYIIGVMPNETDDFRQVSYVNGIEMKKGGNHIDYICKEVVGGLRDIVVKKYKTIKPGDIKNKIMVIAIYRGFVNPLFDSQTKESLTNGISDIKSYMGDVDWTTFIKAAYKTEGIMEPIIETFRIRIELARRKGLKGMSKGKKKYKCEKYLPPINATSYFALCEGASACNSLAAVLGRDTFGFYELKGVPLNTYEAKISRIVKNVEIADIINILQIRLDIPNHDMTYDNVLIATDQDLDGFHISGILIGFFTKYLPEIVKAGRLCRLRTPVIALKKKNIIKHIFFTMQEYNEYADNNNTKGLDVEYYKGLGSWSSEELQDLISNHGISYFIERIEYDATAHEVIDNWFSGDKVAVRKQYLQDNNFSIFNM